MKKIGGESERTKGGCNASSIIVNTTSLIMFVHVATKFYNLIIA